MNTDAILKPNFQNIPEELKELPQWVVWKLVPNIDKDGAPKKPRKVPIDPKTGRDAKANDPRTWGTYDQALEFFSKLKGKEHNACGKTGKICGLGFEFSSNDPYVGIDLDHCWNGSGPQEWALDIIRDFGSYAEQSPTGTGAHILLRGKLPQGRRRKGSIEVYEEGRYFTVTGRLIDPNFRTIEDRSGRLQEFHSRVLAESGKKAENQAQERTNTSRTTVDEAFILERAPKAKNGPLFSRLWNGDISGCDDDNSKADLALCNILAFWTRKDPVLMDSLFRRSGLMREKWDRVHRPADGATYGKMTIEKAMADCRAVYEGPKQKTEEKKPSDPPEINKEGIDGFPLTEDGIALAFAERFKNELRYCHHTGKWFHWNDGRWKREETKLAFNWARSMCRDLGRIANDARVKAGIAKASTAAAVERFAQADRAFAVTSEIWDRDQWVIGTPEGVVDLRIGMLRQARQEDFITKQTNAAPSPGVTPLLWLRFLDEATNGDKDLQRFLQQMCGYCLTGDIREHSLFFIYGPGGNGKSVFLNAVVNILGDYARTAAMDTFTASKSDKHPTDLAMLQGARMVSVSETEEGRAWAESRIKQLTGGDRISARFMRQDFFEYMPQFKLVIIGNHKPVLRNVDDAARRRFNIIPFVHKPECPDKQLEQKLRTEYPAILRWMIDGCLDWQRNGLIRPNVVADATKAYFDDQDLFGQWLEECCEVGPRQWEITSRLFASWKDFSERNGERPGSVKAFSANMLKREFTPDLKRVHGTPQRLFKGISLKTPQVGGGSYAESERNA